MTQPALFNLSNEHERYGCLHRRSLLRPCVECQALADELHQRFDAAVLAGHYDADGFTPTDRKTQATRRQERLNAQRSRD